MSTPLPREEAAAQFSSAREGSVCAGVELAPQMDDVRSSRSRRARLCRNAMRERAWHGRHVGRSQVVRSDCAQRVHRDCRNRIPKLWATSPIIVPRLPSPTASATEPPRDTARRAWAHSTPSCRA